MKTTQSRKNKGFRKMKKQPGFRSDSDALAVLRDVSNGKEYFLSIIDSFAYSGNDYVVMYNYEPDDGNHSDPEIVIMRSKFADNGNQCFYSITNNGELDAVFDKFIDRFTGSLHRSGESS